MTRAAILSGCIVTALSAAGCSELPPAAAPAPAGVSLSSDILLEPDVEIIEARVPRNATLAGLLRGHELPSELIVAVVNAAREVFNPRQLRADHPYRLVRTFDGLLRQFEYHIDADRYLRLVHLADREEPAFEVEILTYEKETALLALRGEIRRDQPSLVAAIAAAGETVHLAIALAEIFGGEIDFHSDLRDGDSFDVLFEKTLRDGEFAGYGPVLAAELQNGPRRLRAFRFLGEDGRPGYYDEQGRSLRRFFLRSPLRIDARISSGFTHRRLHPVHRTHRPHLGIDYAAPHGSPVVAVATGTVVFAAYAGANGRMVRIRHSRGYESYYLHLSSFAPGIRRGARVQQGQLIGRVGATGTATGPHLDYRLRRNGIFVNPLIEHRRMPPGDPIAPSRMAAFEAERDVALSRFVGPLLARRDADPEPEMAHGLPASE